MPVATGAYRGSSQCLNFNGRKDLRLQGKKCLRKQVMKEQVGKMLTICFCSTKGGGGKSTLTAHLSVEAEKQGDGPVAIIDADPQASLARWWNLRQAATPAFIQTKLEEIPRRLTDLKEAGFKFVMIDTPGADVGFTRSILKHADLTVIPSRPSPLDLGTLGATVEMVEAESVPLLFVLNAVTPRTRISAQAMMALSQHGPVTAMIHQRTDYASSMTDGRVAGELDPSSRSADEIAQLWHSVLKALRKQAKKPVREKAAA
jgi:chromosome partitioning protein